MWSPIIKHFGYKHLSPEQEAVSQQLYGMARKMDQALPGGPEKEMGLRKLLEARDCFVRSASDSKPR